MTSQASLGITITFVALASIGVAAHFLQRIKTIEKELRSQSPMESIDVAVAHNEEAEDAAKKSFTMTEIGRIHSPFPQRAGCPRQGGRLAPHIRSRLIFHPNIPIEMLDGITSYSHVWVVFAFHLNPRGKASSGRQGHQVKFTATKIRPLRANGFRIICYIQRSYRRHGTVPNQVQKCLSTMQPPLSYSTQIPDTISLRLKA